jgi:hypothetical protein
MIGEILAALLDSTAILLQEGALCGALLTEESIPSAVLCGVPVILCGTVLGMLCGMLPGLLCCTPTCGLSLSLCAPGELCGILPGWLCGMGGGICGAFVGQKIIACLPEPLSKFIEPLISCASLEWCPTL